MRYRDITEAPTRFPERAYDLLSEYVTHGSSQTPDQFDRTFDELMRLLPRPRRAMTLYRVLRLLPSHIVWVGGVLRLDARRYSSWTKSSGALDRLLYDRARPGYEMLVVKAVIPAQNIVVDVAAFYKRHGLTSADYGEWSRYVRPEQEVIVQHNDPLRITRDMIVDAGEAVVNAAPPHVGETFIATDGNKEKIGGVDLQSGALTGVYQIAVAGDPAFIRRDRRGRWVEIDR